MQNYMKGKICLVTGATSGIGLEIAGGLAALGATVIIAGRNEDIGKQVVQDIKKRTGNGFIELMLADFSTQAGVIHLADMVKERYDKLDVLVNNAGLYQPDHTLTSDGIEMTFAVNYLAPFLLSHELHDLLLKGQPSRIVITASSFHKTGYLDFNDLNMNEKKYSGMQAYMNSKVALIMFTYTLAEKVKGMGITVNAVHPGIVKTKLPRQRSFYSFLLKAIPFFLTPKQGAKTSIYLASSPEVEHITGKYFIRKKPAQSSDTTYSIELQKQLWEKSCELTHVNGYEQ
ncbi:MAG TPA: SDR family oxidoreductase [Candidatus Bathyarchaeia archaeon]|nr:SDR family oxidoreductase [Candidatus Bathyarchaeia archaeon]